MMRELVLKSLCRYLERKDLGRYGIVYEQYLSFRNINPHTKAGKKMIASMDFVADIQEHSIELTDQDLLELLLLAAGRFMVQR